MNRSSGLLLHITSLPGEFGVGDFGDEALRLLDWMADAGFSWWQTLPLNPPGYGNSPYQPWSAFAGNPLLISPQLLAANGLLTRSELKNLPSGPSESRADFSLAEEVRSLALRRAFRRFEPDDLYRHFVATQQSWLEDVALFRALSLEQNGAVWTEWPEELARPAPDALDQVRDELAEEIEFQRFIQYQFFLQHDRLRREASERGIGLIGDLPIFVAHDSADVWSHQHLFELDDLGNPTVVAGVPPDYFSETGQRWGNPLYRWNEMKRDRYRWWIERLRAAFLLYDALRIDHFRGFAAYWEIPGDEETAVNGSWVEGPGHDFFETVMQEFHHPAILAEDLGEITPDVIELRDHYGFPGMKVLQFGGPDSENVHLPHNYTTPDSVVYTGTHDNDTTVGWWSNSSTERRSFWRDYTGKGKLGGRKKSDVADEMIRLALSSIARLAVIPVQDLLHLGSDSRMNVPGRGDIPNWSWRMTSKELDRKKGEMYRALNRLYGRAS